MNSARSVFTEDGFTTETEIGTTQWKYESILEIVEVKGNIAFVIDQNHGQLYDMSSISGGTPAEFKVFIEKKTGKTIQKI